MKKYLIIQSSIGLACAAVIFTICVQPAVAQTSQAKDPFVKKKQGAPSTAANEPDDEAPLTHNIVVEVEFIDVPRDKLMAYRKDPGIKIDATPLRKQVQSWIKGGDASILESSLISTRSGQRAKVESVRECIYPTEWDSRTQLPTSFETRNEGTTLEVDPILSPDGSVISLSVAPEVVTHVGETPALPKPKWWQEGDFHVPHFSTIRSSVAVDCVPEQYTLLDAKPLYEKPDTRSILTFARCARSPVTTGGTGTPTGSGPLIFSWEWIEVPTAEVGSWACEQKLAEIPADAYGAAQDWIERDIARVKDVSTIQALSGQRAKSESISEVLYYTEVVGKDGVIVPVAYETRNQGTTVEMEFLAPADSRYGDLNLAPEITMLVGNAAVHRSSEGEPDVIMPLFYTSKCQSAVTFNEDKPTLIATMTPPGENGKTDRSRKWLLFVTAER